MPDIMQQIVLIMSSLDLMLVDVMMVVIIFSRH